MVYFNNATFTMAQIQSDASLNYKSGSEVLNKEKISSHLRKVNNPGFVTTVTSH